MNEKPKERNDIKNILFNLKIIFIGILIFFILSVVLLKIQFKLNIILSLIIPGLAVFVIFIIIKRLLIKALGKAGFIEEWHNLYGDRITNIPYFKNDMIINSFKKDGDNYNDEIGNVNNGRDYQKNERNYYDLYIPYLALKKKEKHNGIMIFIHGGGWIQGSKESLDYLCSRYAKFGYITATMNYTLLIKKYKEHNVFRILDEITSCIKDIICHLKNLGFDESKLELALGGNSAGAHLSMLYGYSIKKCPLPIKFIINIVGPVSLEPEYFYCIKNDKSLESIEPQDIEIAKKDKKLEKFLEDELYLLERMNGFIGNKYTNKEIQNMIENKRIKTDNEKYKEMLKIAQNGFPVKFINSKTVPTLCEYGGKDNFVGVAQYSYLKRLSEKYGNKIVLIYMKDGGHALESYDTKDGMNSIKEMHDQIIQFAKTYFTNDK